MKLLQQFPGSLLHKVLLDRVNLKEFGLLEGQFVTSLESKFHTPTPRCESKLFGNKTVCGELSGSVKKYLLVYLLDFTILLQTSL